jgi:hypothetical protein
MYAQARHEVLCGHEVDTKALGKIQNFMAEYLEMQRSLMDVRWTVGTKPEELMKVVEGVYSNYLSYCQ